MLQKIFKRTHKGSGFGDLLGTMVCIVALMVVLISMVHFYKVLEIKRNINSYARSSLLTLEQEGELSQDDIDEITQKLVKIGFNSSDIKITYNNDNSAATYGKEVTISVEVKATYKELGFSAYFSRIIGETFNYKTTYTSISKQ